MKIGIGITTVPKRKALHKVQMEHIKKHTPSDVFIYVHNDTKGIGVAKSKNNCLAALMDAGCTHLFLLDDDVYPTSPEWMNLFFKTKENHLCATFDKLINGAPNGNAMLKRASDYDVFANPCGMMMFYKRFVIERIGGMDIRYSKWGHEHVGHSMRIFNSKITPHAFMSPRNVMKYIHSLDHAIKTPGVFSNSQKSDLANEGRPIYSEDKRSIDWKPYKKADYVLTAFYTQCNDEQRNNRRLSPDTKILDPLLKSAPCEVVTFTDIYPQSNPSFKYIHSRVPRGLSMYNHRFLEFKKWLTINLEYCNIVYLLDSTDTEFIGEAHRIEKGKVYINTEGKGGSSEWLIDKARKANIPTKCMTMRGNDLWNTGVIYGHAEDVLSLLEAMEQHLKSLHLADMPTLNLVCNQGVHGIEFVPVKSGFKSTDKTDVYIRHK